MEPAAAKEFLIARVIAEAEVRQVKTLWRARL
jgi:hypothetical protein